jgi:NADPH:quinone reductase-like Zn-dependent oxidoreductase
LVAGSAVGRYAVQLAIKAGLYVVAVAGFSIQHAKDLGADVVVNYRTEDVAATVENVAHMPTFCLEMRATRTQPRMCTVKATTTNPLSFPTLTNLPLDK